MNAPPTITLVLRPRPGIDAVRALRALLKAIGRQYGFQCVGLSRSEGAV